ncbi:rho GTPase-activating protein 25-like [Engraulis encrasicolus]|uniref:rho GTPase-activating protein 25-like n=1 Tax=Engraulis encrasicolus TaxID=184585 RepID=UPI002FD0EB02
MGRKEEGWPLAAGTPSRDHDLHYYRQHHYYRQSPHHQHHQQHPHQQQDAVSRCSSTHESIVSLYDNLEQPRQRSPIDDDSQDLDLDLDLDPDNADFESEWLLEHDWRDCLERSRTEDKLTYACGSREDRRPSQGAQSAKPQKRSSDNPDDNPFLFSAAESKPKVQRTPRPLSESSILETVIADVPEEVLLQQGSTMDLHTTSLQLKLSYPPSSPANSLPTSGSPPAVPQRTDNSTMTVLLGNIKQQIVQQKEEYETQIHRLEQRNEALEVEVLGLRANLEQQRRWYRAVEQRLCEVERARADADRRNAELQSQMEQFFDAFGELTNEAKKTERIVQGFE